MLGKEYKEPGEAHENKKARLERLVDKELNSLQKDMTA